MKIINKILVIFFALLLNTNLALSGEKWDMALAYGAGNFHSANATELAKNVTGCNLGETSKDDKFTLVEVECLGACCNAPMIQINDDYYEDLTEENFKHLLLKLKENEKISTGSQTGRQSSEPKRK